MTAQFHPEVAIIGAGPAGLMAAEVLTAAGVPVAVYDAMPSAGRKFLMAGKGGMNITHAEPFDAFIARYAERSAELQPMLQAFNADDLRHWLKQLGIATFVGSSGRVFPLDMKAAPLLRAWLHRLRTVGAVFHMRHRWLGWDAEQRLVFATEQGQQHCRPRAVILALGGASWPQLGSTGAWVSLLAEQGVAIADLQPSNCGFELRWSEFFKQRFNAQPVKTVRLQLVDQQGRQFAQSGELMVTEYGLEGGLLYALSAPLREQIAQSGSATLTLDLLPDWSLEKVTARLSKPRGKQSLSNQLRKSLGLDGVKAALLREVTPAEMFNQPVELAKIIKVLPLTLQATRPLSEAISTAGGVRFDQLDAGLMLKKLPGVFCAGEMLDWEAPTGGYLMTACFATGRTAGLGALNWLAGTLSRRF